MSGTVLVVAAHPDDEVLGMGGTIARHAATGDAVYVLFLADGVGARADGDPSAVEKRRQAAHRACTTLGATITDFHAFPDNAFDTVSLLSIAKAVESAKAEVRPDFIYTHHGGDLNIDHRITTQAVMTAFRPQPHETYAEVRSFEINSSTEWSHSSVSSPFLADTYVDIGDHLETLTAAYECYTEEVRPDPHSRSVEALRIVARLRGRQVGLRAAEAFMTLRRIVR